MSTTGASLNELSAFVAINGTQVDKTVVNKYLDKTKKSWSEGKFFWM